ncbi:MAG TPA: transporter substrate-binding protein [Bradyrhizobium sp.]|nr:transporter substrate-binding protein [Bradyrhizobium sp.]
MAISGVQPHHRIELAHQAAETADPADSDDPMEFAYILFHMWAQAVQQAGTTNVDAVRRASLHLAFGTNPVAERAPRFRPLRGLPAL